jgi:hypothetical protein
VFRAASSPLPDDPSARSLWIASHSGWFNSVLRAVAFHVTQLLSFSCFSLSSLYRVPPLSIVKENTTKALRLFILLISLCSSISIPPISSSPFFALATPPKVSYIHFSLSLSLSLFRRVMLVAGGRWRKVEVKKRVKTMMMMMMEGMKMKKK